MDNVIYVCFEDQRVVDLEHWNFWCNPDSPTNPDSEVYDNTSYCSDDIPF